VTRVRSLVTNYCVSKSTCSAYASLAKSLPAVANLFCFTVPVGFTPGHVAVSKPWTWNSGDIRKRLPIPTEITTGYLRGTKQDWRLHCHVEPKTIPSCLNYL